MIWLVLFLVGVSGSLLLAYIDSRRWISALVAAASFMLNIQSVVIQVEIRAVDAANARFAAKCVDAPAEIPYRAGMTLCPGQTAVIHIPAELVVPSGSDI